MPSANPKGSAATKGIVDILINRKLATEGQLQPAIEEAHRSERPIQQVIVDKKILEKTVVLKALSEEWRIKAVNLTDIEVDLDVVKVIPETTARRHKAVPFAKEENVLFVSMVDPRDFFAVEDMQLRTGFEVQPYLALPGDIDALLNTAYGTANAPVDASQVDVSVEDIIKGVGAGQNTDELTVGSGPDELSDVGGCRRGRARSRKASERHYFGSASAEGLRYSHRTF